MQVTSGWIGFSVRLVLVVCLTVASSLSFADTSQFVTPMTRTVQSNAVKVPGILRVKFSKLVSVDTLELLHGGRLQGPFPDELSDLVHRAEIASLKAVFSVSQEELQDDRYGFAREFEARLQPSANADSAARVLRSSPLVETVKPVLVRRPQE